MTDGLYGEVGADELPVIGRVLLGAFLTGSLAGIALASALGATAILAGLAADRLRRR